MKKDTVKKHLKSIYEALELPIYLYEDSHLDAAFPENAVYLPPAFCLTKADSGDFSCPYITTAYSSLYGCIRLFYTENAYIVIGPVTLAPYTRADFQQMFEEYHTPHDEWESFRAFFHNIPSHSAKSLGNIMQMIHHFLNPGELPLDIEFDIDILLPEQILQKGIQNVYDQKNFSEINHSLEYEAILIKIVEQGQVAQIKEIKEAFFDFRTGILADNPIRNAKNLVIALITVISRAAIRGGIDAQVALQLSDLYIQNTEKARDIQEVAVLLFDSLLAFTKQVASVKYSYTHNADISQIIAYVRQHTDQPLTVAYLADIFGYSRDYLSAKFKRELGFGLASFIYRTKIEEAKQLLLYTNKSLLEISEFLCFSSQSHFQNVFKKQYHMTPLQFRKQAPANTADSLPVS